MLFNSHEFIFLYLPVVLFGFFWIAGSSRPLAALWMAAASLFFYGWWNPQFVLLLLASIGFNYIMGYAIGHARTVTEPRKQSSRILAAAIVGNLLLLAYFKYADFIISTANQLVGSHCGLANIVLPLGISFFTFTQIAFLVDVHRGIAREYKFIHYLLFVTYFPHLIAGPVLHHKEMMPQFALASTYRFNAENLSVGMTIFVIGLFKKVILADGLANYADCAFAALTVGPKLSFIEAWAGALSYSLQLYFDFSGYSDMAIGVSRMFGVVLPLNFHSPYKSPNIIEFWRRWHMTLSRFLRDYLYIPLGGNRKGNVRRQVNLMLTMLLGGMWHGAGWTFVIWGGMHGVYLVINHAWHGLRVRIGQVGPSKRFSGTVHVLAVLITFLAVVAAWVVFRAESIGGAVTMLKSMAGGNGYALPYAWLSRLGFIGLWLSAHGFDFSITNSFIREDTACWLGISLFIVWFAPNTQQILAVYKPALDVPEGIELMRKLRWTPSIYSAALIWLLGFTAIISLSKKSAFLYFQF